MKWVYDDGGREAAGFKGKAGDCVVRAVAIVSGLPYAEVYKALADGMGTQRKSKGRSARNGVSTTRKWFKDYMNSIGFVWVPTMGVGTGCKVHLSSDELPKGRLVVSVSKHYTAVIDGVIRDTYSPYREESFEIGHFASQEQANLWGSGWTRRDDGKWIRKIGKRCVYGYWQLR